MSGYTIVIGNKNYSSWSLRAWLALSQTGADFEEVVVPLDLPETRGAILAHSPAGMVPVLKHGEAVVWDSLAIGEYLAERHPEAGLWPEDRRARSFARSAVCEMHAGFAALRKEWPMDVRRRVNAPLSETGQADRERIVALWGDCREQFGSGGDYLFGALTLADCFYAPVVSRFITYGADLPPVAEAYCEALMAWPAMRRWCEAAEAEPWTIASP